MRASILIVGFIIILFGLLLWIGIGYPIEITGTIGLINIILGLVTPKAPGINMQPESMSQVKLIVDKARSKTGIYQLVFSDTTLVMKKLSGTMGITAATVVFMLIGGMIGGATGFSLQEYLVERKRRRIQNENSLMQITSGDIEIPYDSISQVELVKTKFKILSDTGSTTIVMSRKYVAMIADKLREIIPSRCWTVPIMSMQQMP